MKKLMFILLMMVSMTASANVTVTSLLGVCNAKDVMSQVTCHTYMVGVLDGLVMADASVCLPDSSIDTNDLVHVSVNRVNALARNKPSIVNKDARIVLYDIYTSMYTCQ